MAVGQGARDGHALWMICRPKNKTAGNSSEQEDKRSRRAGLPSDEAMIFFADWLRSGQRVPGPLSGLLESLPLASGAVARGPKIETKR